MIINENALYRDKKKKNNHYYNHFAELSSKKNIIEKD